MRPFATFVIATAVLAAAVPQAASGQLVRAAPNDFLPTYVGPHNGDMDVIGANVFYNGSTYRFVSRFNGAIGTTTGALYVWGIDRGQGVARFGP